MTSSDPAVKHEKLGDGPSGIRSRALTVIFGDNPTAAERIAFSTVSLIPVYLPELAGLSDDELRESLRSTMLHILRVPSSSTTGTHPTRWPHDPRRINGRDY
jgi:hypothetical protein